MTYLVALCLVWPWYVADSPLEKVQLIRHLGSPVFAVRQAATLFLNDHRTLYYDLLGRASSDPDPEVSRRALLILTPEGYP